MGGGSENRGGDGQAEKRRHSRIPLCSRILITHPAIGSLTLKTRDISHGGVFLVLEDISLLPVGTVVDGQVQDEMDDRPWVRMEVVRLAPSGVGLRFLE
jgi:hypothetical protein